MAAKRSANRPLTEVFTIINEITRKPCENPAELVLSSGKVVELANHTLLVSRDGKGRLIADSGAPIKDRNSMTIGVVLVFRDMTEKQMLQDAMQRSDKLDSLGVLAGGIAHDFNNLLGGIFGYIDMARHVSQADSQAAKYLDKASLVFNRAKDLTQRLLTFSKGGAPVLKTGQLGPLVKESAAFALSGSKISCEYHIANDLWPCDFDENQIAQVVDNIVINAQQAMPMGGTIVISGINAVLHAGEVPGLRAGNFVKVSVADTGVGIPRDLLKRIFDPFFHVLLPASQKAADQGLALFAQEHKGNGTVLVMDDEDFMREIIGMMLKEMGYAVLEARNGEEALRLCVDAHKKTMGFGAAVLDLTIPGGMGGKETIVEMRKICPDMPVFASSGFSEDPVMSNPADYGFTASIRKPYRKDELADLLERYLKRKA
jgi:nitrogen-specific signal transduction histidine kinase/CheY-like chemotaxis protein